MNNPIKHHFVPRLYLKPFIIPGSKGQVWVLDKSTGKHFKRNIDSVFIRNNYYTLETEEDEYRWEKAYSNYIEPNFKEQLVEIITNCNNNALSLNAPIIDLNSKADFSFSLTMQFLRTPVIRDYIASLIPSAKDNVIREPYPLAAGVNESDFWEVINRYDPFDEANIKELTFKTIMFQESLLKDFTYALYRREWHFCVLNKGSPFITSDNPLVTIDFQDGSAGFMKSAFNSNKTGFAFSITPNICLIMFSPFNGMISTRDRTRLFIDAKEIDFIKTLQKYQTENADRLLISKELSSLGI